MQVCQLFKSAIILSADVILTRFSHSSINISKDLTQVCTRMAIASYIQPQSSALYLCGCEWWLDRSNCFTSMRTAFKPVTHRRKPNNISFQYASAVERMFLPFKKLDCNQSLRTIDNKQFKISSLQGDFSSSHTSPSSPPTNSSN